VALVDLGSTPSRHTKGIKSILRMSATAQQDCEKFYRAVDEGRISFMPRGPSGDETWLLTKTCMGSIPWRGTLN
jgi:hypothetical protein